MQNYSFSEDGKSLITLQFVVGFLLKIPSEDIFIGALYENEYEVDARTKEIAFKCTQKSY